MPVQSIVMAYEPPKEFLRLDALNKRKVDEVWAKELVRICPFRLRSKWLNQHQEEDYLGPDTIQVFFSRFFEDLQPILKSIEYGDVTIETDADNDQPRYTEISPKEHRISYVRGFMKGAKGGKGGKPWTLPASHPGGGAKQMLARVVVSLTWGNEHKLGFFDSAERLEMVEAEIVRMKTRAQTSVHPDDLPPTDRSGPIVFV
jgi:hypothetical protein